MYIVSSVLSLVSSTVCGRSRSSARNKGETAEKQTKQERTKWRDPFWGERGPAKKEEKPSQSTQPCPPPWYATPRRLGAANANFLAGPAARCTPPGRGRKCSHAAAGERKRR